MIQQHGSTVTLLRCGFSPHPSRWLKKMPAAVSSRLPRTKSKIFSGRSFVNWQPFLAHIDEMVPCRSCAHTWSFSRIFNLRRVFIELVAPLRFFLLEFGAVSATELSFAPLHHCCQFRLIFFESLRDRSVASFMADR